MLPKEIVLVKVNEIPQKSEEIALVDHNARQATLIVALTQESAIEKNKFP